MSSKLYRVTGPPENILHAMQIGYWGTNDENIDLWNQVFPGDMILFHSTASSRVVSNASSTIVGVAEVGNKKERKKEYWWIDENEDEENYWPNVKSLDTIFLFKDLSRLIDWNTLYDKKNHYKNADDTRRLMNSGISLKSFNRRLKQVDQDCDEFTYMGGVGKVNWCVIELVKTWLDKNKLIQVSTQAD